MKYYFINENTETISELTPREVFDYIFREILYFARNLKIIYCVKPANKIKFCEKTV